MAILLNLVCPRLLNLINDFVLLRFRARAPEDLSAIEVILLLLKLSQKLSVATRFRGKCFSDSVPSLAGFTVNVCLERAHETRCRVCVQL